mmetsp:Transcript_18089/g.59205  ORF Transcript_18089/g.59205 Transcript_18089/m.59205 type:complete len:204 (-) Transcript_18089:1338-1949(-)
MELHQARRRCRGEGRGLRELLGQPAAEPAGRHAGRLCDAQSSDAARRRQDYPAPAAGASYLRRSRPARPAARAGAAGHPVRLLLRRVVRLRVPRGWHRVGGPRSRGYLRWQACDAMGALFVLGPDEPRRPYLPRPLPPIRRGHAGAWRRAPAGAAKRHRPRAGRRRCAGGGDVARPRPPRVALPQGGDKVGHRPRRGLHGRRL